MDPINDETWLLSKMSKEDLDDNKTGQDMIPWLSEVLHTLNSKFPDPSENTQIHVKNAITSIGALRSALRTEKLQKAAHLVQMGEIYEAKQLVIKDFKCLELETVEEVIKLAYNGKTEHLPNVIHFARNASPKDFALSAFKAIYREMQLRKHTQTLPILLLKSNMEITDDGSDTYAQFAKDLNNHEEEIVAKLARQVKSGDFRSFYDLSLKEKLAVAGIAQKIARSAFSSADECVVPRLLKMAKSLRLGTQLDIFIELFDILEVSSSLESSAALHLWAFLNKNLTTLINYTGFTHILLDGTKVDLRSKYEKLVDRTRMYCQLYYKIVAAEQFEVLNCWHDEATDYFDQALPIFLEYFYQWRVLNANAIIFNAIRNFKNYHHANASFNALHDIFIKRGLEKSFAFFQLYVEVKLRMSSSFFKVRDESLAELKNKAPRCVVDLVWRSETDDCKLVNYFFGEVLAFDVKKMAIFTSPPNNVDSTNSSWQICIDSESHFVSLKFKIGDEIMYLHPGIDGLLHLKSGDGNNFVWRIIPDEGENFKISHCFSEQFLTVENHCAFLKIEDNTGMQMWRVDT